MSAFTPIQSIIIHKKDSYDHNSYYVESSSIEKINGKYVTTGYKPLEVETLKALALHFATDKFNLLAFRSLIPENILHYSCTLTENRVIWFNPAGQRHLFFKNNLNIPDGIAEVPPLIFQVSNELSVFAILEKPNPTTILYRAPFHNVNDSGRVCLGNVRMKLQYTYIDELITDYERAFWKSEFSEVHGTPVKGNVNLLWKDLITNRKQFPEEILIKTNKRVKDLL